VLDNGPYLPESGPPAVRGASRARADILGRSAGAEPSTPKIAENPKRVYTFPGFLIGRSWQKHPQLAYRRSDSVASGSATRKTRLDGQLSRRGTRRRASATAARRLAACFLDSIGDAQAACAMGDGPALRVRTFRPDHRARWPTRSTRTTGSQHPTPGEVARPQEACWCVEIKLAAVSPDQEPCARSSAGVESCWVLPTIARIVGYGGQPIHNAAAMGRRTPDVSISGVQHRCVRQRPGQATRGRFGSLGVLYPDDATIMGRGPPLRAGGIPVALDGRSSAALPEANKCDGSTLSG